MRYFFFLIVAALSIPVAVHAQHPADARNSIQSSVTVGAGELATVSWDCKGATEVVFAGDSSRYPSQFILQLRPTKSIRLNFRVLRGNDTSSMYCDVVVRSTDSVRVQRGGDIRSASLPPTSSVQARTHYVGYDTSGTKSRVQRLKILRTSAIDSSSALVIHAALLDSAGNNIAGISTASLSATAQWSCAGGTATVKASGKDTKWVRSQRHMIMSVLSDQSSFATELDTAVRSRISDFSFFLGSGDLLSVLTYDTDLHTVCPHSGKERLNNLRELFYGEAQGLSAPYRAAYLALNKFSVEPTVDNVLVLISAGYDNASLIYSPDDVIAKARKRKTTIMTIGVGDLVDGNALEFIARQTGGRHYHVDADSLSQITDILREINYGIHASYSFIVPSAYPAAASCDDGQLRLSLDSMSVQSAVIPVFADTTYLAPHAQTLCTYAYGSSSLSPSAKSQIQKLITVLRDNPSKSIELISHSFAEGDDDLQRSLCVKRVQEIRSLLLDSGIAASSLRCRTMSDLNPVFPYASSSWQEDFNRRINVRWLDASLLPYEVVTDYVEAEADAISAVQLWSKRNFKAYYEAVNVRQAPAYRVKLWGYESEDEARAAGEIIKKKYNAAYSIE